MAIELKSAPTSDYSREYYLRRENVMFQAEVDTSSPPVACDVVHDCSRSAAAAAAC